MNRLSTVRVVSVFCSGLMAGLLFGDWLGPSFARSAMNVASFVEFQQIVHVNYLRTLPALSTLALAAPKNDAKSSNVSTNRTNATLSLQTHPRIRAYDPAWFRYLQ